MEVCIIAAVSSDRAIGKDNSLLWHISEDLRYFKALTTGFPVIMGRRTFESIGRPLPKRMNIVLSRSGFSPEGTVAASSLDAALKEAASSGSEKCFVIGGVEIYSQAMELADRLYLTEVDTEAPDADTFFPEISPETWKEESRSERKLDEKSGLGYDFAVYVRRKTE